MTDKEIKELFDKLSMEFVNDSPAPEEIIPHGYTEEEFLKLLKEMDTHLKEEDS